MIDLHCHVLPGLDDGPETRSASLALARAAAAEGVTTIVATPHVDGKHVYDLDEIRLRTEQLNAALAEEGVPTMVVTGGEIALERLAELDDPHLRQLGLGGSSCLLVESPYVGPVPFLELAVLELRKRGFRPLLAHPERSAVFQDEPGRLEELVEKGVLCSLDSGSLIGRFGSRVRGVALRLLSQGLAHNVASDAHDLDRRPPDLSAAFQAAERDLPGISRQAGWYTCAAPRALLDSEALPPRPAPPERPGLLRRLAARRR